MTSERHEEHPTRNRGEVKTERSLAAKAAAHLSWANTTDRTARTAPARRALDQKFLDQATGDPVRAERLRRAFYARLALKSVQARRRSRPGTDGKA